MLSVKKLLAKLLGAISTIKGNITTINSKLTVTTPSISITASTGTLVSSSVRRFGNVVQLTVQVRNATQTASGGDIFNGQINTTALRPLIIASSGSYYGAYPLNGRVDNNGNIYVRNAAPSPLTIGGSNYTVVSFTYIVGGST